MVTPAGIDGCHTGRCYHGRFCWFRPGYAGGKWSLPVPALPVRKQVSVGVQCQLGGEVECRVVFGHPEGVSVNKLPRAGCVVWCVKVAQ